MVAFSLTHTPTHACTGTHTHTHTQALTTSDITDTRSVPMETGSSLPKSEVAALKKKVCFMVFLLIMGDNFYIQINYNTFGM